MADDSEPAETTEQPDTHQASSPVKLEVRWPLVPLVPLVRQVPVQTELNDLGDAVIGMYFNG